MENSIENIPGSKKEIKVKVLPKEFEGFYQKAVSELGKDVEAPGFRKGKAPREAVEKTLGKEKILAEAVQETVRESYAKAVRENNVEALGQPKIEISKFPSQGQALEFKAEVPVMPELKLPDYKGIASGIKRKPVEVSEKELEDAVKWLQKSRAKFTAKPGPAQKGDWVEIEYKREGSSQVKDAFTLGEGHFPEGFEDSLAGMKSGEEKSFQAGTPKGSEKTGYWVKLDSVQKMEVPELTDSFAKSLGQFENFKALEQSVKAGLKQEKEIQEAQRARQEMVQKIAEKTEMEIPEILVEEQKKKYLENLKKEVAQKLQTGFKEYLDKIKKTEEELLESFKGTAEKQVRNSLVLREIQKKENIQPSEEEVKSELQRILQKYPNPEEIKKQFSEEQLESYARELLRQEKVFQILEQS